MSRAHEKVLLVIGQLGYGGAERQLYELSSRLPAHGFEPVVCVLSGPGPLLSDLEAAGVRVACLDKKPGMLSGSTAALLSMLRRERPAIVHSYLFSANWRALLAGRIARTPLIISSVRNVDIHSTWWTKALERALAHLTDQVIANAEAVKDYVAREHWVASEKIHVVHNGISLERFGEGATEAPGRRTVAVLASLTPKKDHATFIDAAAIVRRSLPDARFLIVGDGPERAGIEARAARLGIADAVKLCGATDDVPGVLAGVDVSVLTSRKEGCSNAVLESMAAGRPVVATDVGGNRELIVEGVTGHLVPAGDAAAVADRVVRVLADPGLAARMGKEAARRARTEFTVELMVERTVALYERFLEERRA